ncbi:YerC/YecD family TrpR-related protein [Patescibacteria group bacterium]|nr:YerC/YecD family TrpR-related protein [Patescibacteria group bacterium]MCL5091316.1 YerC/YecD family TrpR-related protein [Patescibacteria group bacterium]
MANARKLQTTKFRKTETYVPRNEREKLLTKVIKGLKTDQEVASLLRDLMTPSEIAEFANRITIAQKLLEGEAYQKIAREIGTSTTTVTRVAHWLFSGCGGYHKALGRKKT